MKATSLSNHNNIFTRSSKSTTDKKTALDNIKDIQLTEFFTKLNQFINLGHDKRYAPSHNDATMGYIATLGRNRSFNQEVTRSLATAIIAQVFKLSIAMNNQKLNNAQKNSNRCILNPQVLKAYLCALTTMDKESIEKILEYNQEIQIVHVYGSQYSLKQNREPDYSYNFKLCTTKGISDDQVKPQLATLIDKNFNYNFAMTVDDETTVKLNAMLDKVFTKTKAQSFKKFVGAHRRNLDKRQQVQKHDGSGIDHQKVINGVLAQTTNKKNSQDKFPVDNGIRYYQSHSSQLNKLDLQAQKSVIQSNSDTQYQIQLNNNQELNTVLQNKSLVNNDKSNFDILTGLLNENNTHQVLEIVKKINDIQTVKDILKSFKLFLPVNHYEVVNDNDIAISHSVGSFISSDQSLNTLRAINYLLKLTENDIPQNNVGNSKLPNWEFDCSYASSSDSGNFSRVVPFTNDINLQDDNLLDNQLIIHDTRLLSTIGEANLFDRHYTAMKAARSIVNNILPNNAKILYMIDHINSTDGGLSSIVPVNPANLTGAQDEEDRIGEHFKNIENKINKQLTDNFKKQQFTMVNECLKNLSLGNGEYMTPAQGLVKHVLESILTENLKGFYVINTCKSGKDRESAELVMMKALRAVILGKFLDKNFNLEDFIQKLLADPEKISINAFKEQDLQTFFDNFDTKLLYLLSEHNLGILTNTNVITMQQVLKDFSYHPKVQEVYSKVKFGS